MTTDHKIRKYINVSKVGVGKEDIFLNLSSNWGREKNMLYISDFI